MERSGVARAKSLSLDGTAKLIWQREQSHKRTRRSELTPVQASRSATLLASRMSEA